MQTGRKVVYVLGAGASMGAGSTAKVQHGGVIVIPTQKTFWPTFLKFSKSNENRKTIQSFLFRYFTEYDRVPAKLTKTQRGELLANIDVEEVFTFLSERSQSPSTPIPVKTYMNRIWAAMVEEIGNVFGRFNENKNTRKIYRKFFKNHIKRRDAVVSFNYDTVFENSLPKHVKWGYHCIDPTTNKLSIYKPHAQ